MKALSAGQNREVVYSSWGKLREAGAVVEEAVDSDEDEDGEGGEKEEYSGEKEGEVDEKARMAVRIDANGNLDSKELPRLEDREACGRSREDVDLR